MITLIFLIISVVTSSNGLGLLRNFKYSTKCLSVQSSSRANNAEYQLVDCDPNSAAQWMDVEKWEGYNSSPGQLLHVFNNKCPSVNAWGTDHGVHILPYDCSNQRNQQWWITNGAYTSTFQLKSESSTMCITAEGGGTYMDQWECYAIDSAPHQFWKIDFIEPTPKKSILQSVKYPNKCLHTQGSSFDNNAELELMDCDKTNSEQWFDVSNWENIDAGGGIGFTLNRKCITVIGQGTDDGVHVNQYDCVNPLPNNQLWGRYTDNSGDNAQAFQLINFGSGKCLTAEGGGTYMDQWACYSISSSPHQFWIPISVTFGGPGEPQQDPTSLNPPNPVYAALENAGGTADQCIYTGSTSAMSSLSIASCATALKDGRIFQVADLQNYIGKNGFLQLSLSGFCIAQSFTFAKGDKGVLTATRILKLVACKSTDPFQWTIGPSLKNPTYFMIKNLRSNSCVLTNSAGEIGINTCNPGLPNHYWKLRYPYADDWCGGNPYYKKCSGDSEGQCCSKNGGCGLSDYYCGTGCQDAYGGNCKKLQEFTRTTSNAYSILHRRCGPVHGKKCTKSKTACCSNQGECGTTLEHCKFVNNKCLMFWGVCKEVSELSTTFIRIG